MTVSARFVGGHPRNDLKLESSYSYIDQQQIDGGWLQLYTDNDWFTRYEYEQDSEGGSNFFRVDWILQEDTEVGIYRIRHEGESAAGTYSGVSDPFEITACVD